MTTVQRVATRRTDIKLVDFAPEYLDGMLRVARQIHAGSIYRDVPMDEGKLARQLSATRGVVGADRFFKLAVRGGAVLGGFYGCVHRTFFCDELMAKDIGWWVDESVRGSVAAVLLLAAFERWARDKGALKVMIGQTGAKRIEETRKLFEHCGYAVCGYNTVKDLA